MKKPVIHESVYVAEGARIIGDVTIAEDASVWYNAVIRGDSGRVTIGKKTNIQDCCVVHLDEEFPVSIGDEVVIGHSAIIHGCTIGDGSLIGMGSIILNGAKIGKNCIIGAGSLVTGKMDLPDGMMAMGSPAKAVRPVKEEELKETKADIEHYWKLAQAAKAEQNK